MAEHDRLTWPEEALQKIREIADGEVSMPEIRRTIYEETGFQVSISALRRKMMSLDIPIRRRGYMPPVTDEMKDFVFVKVKEGLPLSLIQKLFNERFDRNYNYSRLWRIAIETGAVAEVKMTMKTFAEDWVRLQAKFAPDGAICHKHWLWRWRRLDENRTAEGCVFRGKKQPVPHLMNTKQFRDEWTAMQRSFGIQTENT